MGLEQQISQAELEFLERLYNRFKENGLLDGFISERQIRINVLDGSITFKSSGTNKYRSMHLDEWIVKKEEKEE